MIGPKATTTGSGLLHWAAHEATHAALVVNPVMRDQLVVEAHLRRSVSGLYYAVFHAIADVCASRVATRPTQASHSAAWLRVYRSTDHATMKRGCIEIDQLLAGRERERVLVVTRAFQILQEERHRADYDPAPYTRDAQAVLEFVNLAQDAIVSLGLLSDESRDLLVSHLLFRKR